MNCLTPSYFTELLTFAKNEHYNLRSSENKDLFVVKPRTNYIKNTFAYKAMKIWNNLPTYIKCQDKLPAFKHALKGYLLAK
jgi:hypothetical protein